MRPHCCASRRGHANASTSGGSTPSPPQATVACRRSPSVCCISWKAPCPRLHSGRGLPSCVHRSPLPGPYPLADFRREQCPCVRFVAPPGDDHAHVSVPGGGHVHAPLRHRCLPSCPVCPYPRLHSIRGPCLDYDSKRGLSHSSTSNQCLLPSTSLTSPEDHAHAFAPRGAHTHASPPGWATPTIHRNRCLPLHASWFI